jgi:hypothetical protein
MGAVDLSHNRANVSGPQTAMNFLLLSWDAPIAPMSWELFYKNSYRDFLGKGCNWCSGSAAMASMIPGLNLNFWLFGPAPIGRLRLACQPDRRPSFALSHNPSGRLKPSALPVASTARQFPSRLKFLQPWLDRPLSLLFSERSEPFRLCTDQALEWLIGESGYEARHMRRRLSLPRGY